MSSLKEHLSKKTAEVGEAYRLRCEAAKPVIEKWLEEKLLQHACEGSFSFSAGSFRKLFWQLRYGIGGHSIFVIAEAFAEREKIETKRVRYTRGEIESPPPPEGDCLLFMWDC